MLEFESVLCNEKVVFTLITAHIRRMGEGNIFSLFVSPHPGGTPGLGSFAVLSKGKGVPQFQVLSQISGHKSFFGVPSQPRLGHPPARTGAARHPPPPPGQVTLRRYASYGFPAEGLSCYILVGCFDPFFPISKVRTICH